VIINRPNGENVYPGVKIDYKGKVRLRGLLCVLDITTRLGTSSLKFTAAT